MKREKREERREMRMKKALGILTAVVIGVAALVGCGGGGGGKDKSITLLNGQFSEIDIIIQMAGMLIEKNTDLSVSYHDSMNTVAAAQAITSEEVDVYVGYDGTLLTTILGYDPSDVPEGESLFDWAKAKGTEEQGITLLDKFGFENTYALAIKRELAEEHNIKTISDLVPHSVDLVFGAEHEFFDEEGTMRFNPFNLHYGFAWKDAKSLEMGLKYAAMDSGNIDVTMVYSTDGLNKKSDLVILEDNLSFFPEYFAAFQFRDTLFEEFEKTAPNLRDTLSQLNGIIDNEAMIEMNYAVDAEGQSAEEVAKKFLIENGLL